MLAPSIFEENFIDDLFGFPMKEFDDMERKLYGRKANRMMKTDIREKKIPEKNLIAIEG